MPVRSTGRSERAIHIEAAFLAKFAGCVFGKVCRPGNLFSILRHGTRETPCALAKPCTRAARGGEKLFLKSKPLGSVGLTSLHFPRRAFLWEKFFDIGVPSGIRSVPEDGNANRGNIFSLLALFSVKRSFPERRDAVIEKSTVACCAAQHVTGLLSVVGVLRQGR